MRRRDGGDLEPGRERLGRRLRADRDHGEPRTGRGERPGRRAGPTRDVAVRRAAGARSSGRAARSRRPARRAARPRRRRGVRGPGRKLVTQALLRVDRRDEVDVQSVRRSAAAVAGPTPRSGCADRRDARELVRAVHARDDDPVVARRIDRLVAERLDADERAAHRPRARAPRAGRARLPASARVTTIHVASAELAPSAAGSSPVRRSTQRPSSAATSP